jgi:hypothetical protein
MKLALRKTDTPTLFGKLFNLATRWRLHTDYPHAGIVIDGSLYHTTYSRGLHRSPFSPDGWDVFEVDAEPSYVRAMFNVRKGAKYDAISLLAFLLPWRIRDSRRLYCYEWCWLAITGENPSERVTPEKLLALVAAKG